MYLLWVIASAVLGAGLMYFIDPRGGSARRNRVKNTAKSYVDRAAATASNLVEDVRVRAYVAADDAVEDVTTRAYVMGDDALDAAADTLEDAQVRGYVAADDAVDTAKSKAKKAAKNVKSSAAKTASKARSKAKEKASDLADDMRSKAVAVFEKVHTTVEDMTPDELRALLLHEVRTAVERVAQNPTAIKIVVEDDGRVILRGPAMPEEVDRLVEAVDAVPGVTLVENDLDAHGMVGDNRSMYNPENE